MMVTLCKIFCLAIFVTVHLAGLSILAQTHTVLGRSRLRQYNINVLMHALLTAVVLLPSGAITGNAGYKTRCLVIINIQLSHSLK